MEKRTKIIVVDDEDIVRESLQDWLDGVGYNVEVAASAEEALEILKKKKINIMLADLVMPGMNGIELMKEAKKCIPPLLLLSLQPTQPFKRPLQQSERALSIISKSLSARKKSNF